MCSTLIWFFKDRTETTEEELELPETFPVEKEKVLLVESLLALVIGPSESGHKMMLSSRYVRKGLKGSADPTK